MSLVRWSEHKFAPAPLATAGGVPDTHGRGIEMAQDTCAFDGCTKAVKSRELCSAHYAQLRKGIPLQPLRVWPTIWEQITESETGCWEYGGTHNDAGYSMRNGKRVHRLTYEELVGPIPDGLVIDHLCRNRGCVNPAHLEAVPQRINTQRGAWSMRTHCPKGHPYDKANTYYRLRESGTYHRTCRTCRREGMARAWRAKRGGAAA